MNGRKPPYVYVETTDGDYSVCHDMHICNHSQTLQVTEIMGDPLNQYHGAPLRLYTPTTYAYKQIQRVGLIAYTDQKRDDYWPSWAMTNLWGDDGSRGCVVHGAATVSVTVD